MNIVLIGYRGAGKSAAGKRLAQRLKREFVDLDGLIEERQGASIRDIVESRGWPHFRALEKEIVEEISLRDDLIIAPGGGAVLEDRNVEALKKNGLIVWLKAGPKALAERVEGDPDTINRRPALTGKGTLEEIQEVMSSRNRIYEKAADVEIETSDLDLEGVVERVLTVFQERREGAVWAGIRSEGFSA